MTSKTTTTKNWTSSKLKTLHFKYQKSAKMTHRIGENIYKSYAMARDLYLEYRSISYKSSIKTHYSTKNWRKTVNRHSSK